MENLDLHCAGLSVKQLFWVCYHTGGCVLDAGFSGILDIWFVATRRKKGDIVRIITGNLSLSFYLRLHGPGGDDCEIWAYTFVTETIPIPLMQTFCKISGEYLEYNGTAIIAGTMYLDNALFNDDGEQLPKQWALHGQKIRMTNSYTRAGTLMSYGNTRL